MEAKRGRMKRRHKEIGDTLLDEQVHVPIEFPLLCYVVHLK